MKLTTHGLRTRAYATDPSPAIHRDSLRTVFAHGVPAFAHEFPGRKACPHTFSTSGYATSHQCHRLAGHRPIRAFCRSSLQRAWVRPVHPPRRSARRDRRLPVAAVRQLLDLRHLAEHG